MLRFSELQQNPVSVTLRTEDGAMLRDKSGAIVKIFAERLRQGLVKLTCRCQDYSRNGWCRHCLAVFIDQNVFEDEKHQNAFEDLVRGTHLEAAATTLIQALDAFSVAYPHMRSVLPAGIDPGQLEVFANRAELASKSAYDLASALTEFIKQAGANARVRKNAPDPNSALSKIKRRTLRMIRKATLHQG
jgi:hypothetical protein